MEETDSDEEKQKIYEKLNSIGARAEHKKMRLGTALKVYIYDRAGPKALVELNENQNQQ